LAFTGREDQAWEGFGGCFNELGWIALQALAAGDRDAVLDALFDPAEGCRFSLCRLPIGASDYAAEWYSHNEADGDYAMKHFSIVRDERHLIPYIRQARRRRPDLTLFASPWSPPTWMKFPKAYNYGTLVWTQRNLDAYALYFVKFIQAYAAAGIPIRQLHMQNEPVADQKFPSCLWSGAQMRDFIRDHLAPAFRAHGLDTELWLGTLNTGDFAGFPLTVMSDPVARARIAGISFQWDGRNAVQRAHQSWPGLRLMQSENECGDGRNTWAYAHYVFALLRHYLTNGVNAYVYWNMVLPEGGLSTWGWRQNAMVTVDRERRTYALRPEFYVMKHFSRFIEPGAVRLELTGPWAGTSVAFRNPDGRCVVVCDNPLDGPQPLRLRHAGRTLAVALPPASFNTLVF